MKTNFNLAAISVAVLAAFGLTACGGSGAFDGGISTTTIFDGNTANSGNTGSTGNTNNSGGTGNGGTTTGNNGSTNGNTDGTTEVDPGDTAFTTFAPNEADRTDPFYSLAGEDNYEAKSEITNSVRGNLHDELEKAYGQRFDTTFIYNTTITDGNSPITGKTHLVAQELEYYQLGNGYQSYTMDERVQTEIDGTKYTGQRTSNLKLYQQNNSIVLGKQTLSGELSNGTNPAKIEKDNLKINTIKGASYDPPSAEELKGLQDARDSTKKALDDAQKAVADADQAIADADQAIADADQAIVDAQQAIINTQAKVNQAQGMVSKARTAFDNAQKSNNPTELLLAQQALNNAIAFEQEAITAKDAAIASEKEAITAKTSAITAKTSAITTRSEAIITEAEAQIAFDIAVGRLDYGKTAFNIWARDPDNLLARGLGVRNEYIDETKNNKIFTYTGQAFNETSDGKLNYEINFNTRTGQGVITELDTGKINLNNASIGTVTHHNPDATSLSMLGIQGVAKFDDGRKDGTYTLGIFGNEATEIAGVVTENNINTVGFGGIKTAERESKITP